MLRGGNLGEVTCAHFPFSPSFSSNFLAVQCKQVATSFLRFSTPTFRFAAGLISMQRRAAAPQDQAELSVKEQAPLQGLADDSLCTPSVNEQIIVERAEKKIGKVRWQ